jgi:membrane-associated phospholipid phosphatase
MNLQRLLPAVLLLLSVATATAQTPDSVPAASSPAPQRPIATPIRWWQVGAAVGGVAAVSLADEGLRTWIIDHRTQGEQDVAGQWQKWGEGTIPVAVTLGTLGTGLLLQKPAVTRTGGRLATSLIVVTLLGRGMKKVIGRARPSEGPDQYTFDPFGKFNAFPSGHTITAFAISTTLADAIDNRWADAGLYTLAAGTGVSRLVGDHHWLSDVVGAAILGTTVAKVVDGKWRIFGLRSPQFLTGPRGGELRWTGDIPGLRR